MPSCCCRVASSASELKAWPCCEPTEFFLLFSNRERTRLTSTTTVVSSEQSQNRVDCGQDHGNQHKLVLLPTVKSTIQHTDKQSKGAILCKLGGQDIDELCLMLRILGSGDNDVVQGRFSVDSKALADGSNAVG